MQPATALTRIWVDWGTWITRPLRKPYTNRVAMEAGCEPVLQGEFASFCLHNQNSREGDNQPGN